MEHPHSVGGRATHPPEDRCPACGTDLKPGEGVTAEWNGQVLRFRGLGCPARFGADPAHYLAGKTDPCRADEWVEQAG